MSLIIQNNLHFLVLAFFLKQPTNTICLSLSLSISFSVSISFFLSNKPPCLKCICLPRSPKNSIHELQSKKVCEEQHLQIKVIHFQLMVRNLNTGRSTIFKIISCNVCSTLDKIHFNYSMTKLIQPLNGPFPSTLKYAHKFITYLLMSHNKELSTFVCCISQSLQIFPFKPLEFRLLEQATKFDNSQRMQQMRCTQDE